MDKVCIFYDYFTPAYKAGGPTQSLKNLVEQLGTELSIRIVCRATDHDGTLLNVVADQWTQVEVGSAKVEVWYARQPLSSRLVKKLVVGADVVYINGIYSFRYNLLPLLFSNALRKIVAVRGMLHPGALSQKSLKKRAYLHCLKIFGVHKAAEFHATVQEEAGYICSQFGPECKVWIASNFPKVLPYQQPELKLQGRLVLVSVGLISSMKNHLFVIRALGNVKGDVEYNIYGPVKEHSYWAECLSAIRLLPPNIRVFYHGDVTPDNVAEALQSAQVFILPSKSENFGHAIFEALTAGKPVITSNNTPWNDLQALWAGLNVGLDGENELSAAISHFVGMDDQEFIKWSQAARAFAETAVDVRKLSSEYLRMFCTKDVISG